MSSGSGAARSHAAGKGKTAAASPLRTLVRIPSVTRGARGNRPTARGSRPKAGRSTGVYVVALLASVVLVWLLWPQESLDRAGDLDTRGVSAFLANSGSTGTGLFGQAQASVAQARQAPAAAVKSDGRQRVPRVSLADYVVVMDRGQADGDTGPGVH